MIYINSCLKGQVKDQIYSFIYDNLTFKYTDPNAMFLFLTSIYNDSNQRKSAVSIHRNLSQHNKTFTKFILKFIYLINNVGYIDN